MKNRLWKSVCSLLGVLVVAVPAVSGAAARETARQKLESRLMQAWQGERWKEALALSDQLMTQAKPDETARYERQKADFYLYDLQLDKAREIYTRTLAGPNRNTGISGDLDKARALYGLARIDAEEGNYQQAITYLVDYKKKYPSRCGTCQRGRDTTVAVLKAVWQAAQRGAQEPDAMGKRLEHLAAGGFTPVTVRYKGTEKSQKEHASRAAGLVLGEMRLRANDTDGAKVWFQKASHSSDDISILAKAHLARL